MLRRHFLLGSAAAAVALVGPAGAQAALEWSLSAGLLADLRKGGFNLFFRHGLTQREGAPEDPDHDTPRPGDCALQRNLSKEGIAQMRGVGEAFYQLGIPVGIVRASPACRCVDTAWWAFGRAERDRTLLLNGDTPEGDPSQARPWDEIRRLGAIPPLPQTNSAFVTHSRVGEIFGGRIPVEGEAVVVRPDGTGRWTLVAQIRAEQWVQP